MSQLCGLKKTPLIWACWQADFTHDGLYSIFTNNLEWNSGRVLLKKSLKVETVHISI